MKLKKIIAILLIAVAILSNFVVISYAITNKSNVEVPTEEVNKKRWHYDQISNRTDDISKTATTIYEVLKEIEWSKIDEEYEVTDNFSQSQLGNYSLEDNFELQTAMNIAKYAFSADYPEIYYVDFEKITIRVDTQGQGTTAKYYAYIGTVDGKSYYTENIVMDYSEKDEVNDIMDIDTVINDFDNEVNKIIGNKPTQGTKTDEVYSKEVVKYAHDEIIKIAEYKTQNTATNTIIDGKKTDNRPHINTPYGVLVRHEGSSFGYTRTFKVLLDRLGIQNIIINGTYKQGDKIASHAWNYVQIGEDWYAVDCMLDELFTAGAAETINSEYLLSDGRNMKKTHIKVEKIDNTDYKIEYPVLIKENEPSFDVIIEQVKTDKELYPGYEFEIIVRMDNLENVQNRISAITGNLEYSKEDLTMVGGIIPLKDWEITDKSYNQETGKFCIERESNPTIKEEEPYNIFKIKFQINKSTNKDKVRIALKNIEGSNARLNGTEIIGTIINAEDTYIDIGIMPLPSEITSNVYKIKEGYISRIPAKTTVQEFKKNITEYPDLVFTNLSEEGYVTTGTIMQAGGMGYTLVVTGDNNGNGVVDVNDIMRIRWHCVELITLSGANLRASDIDDIDGRITVNDLVLIRQLYTNETFNKE